MTFGVYYFNFKRKKLKEIYCKSGKAAVTVGKLSASFYS